MTFNVYQYILNSFLLLFLIFLVGFLLFGMLKGFTREKERRYGNKRKFS